MNKLNCWEIKKCGREPGGDKTDEFGVCPAASNEEGNGLNGGYNGGRICWAMVGTFCGEKIQGDFAQKTVTCMNCEVFKRVKEEEGINDFVLLIAGRPYQPAHR